jgi:hypothetical protein
MKTFTQCKWRKSVLSRRSRPRAAGAPGDPGVAVRKCAKPAVVQPFAARAAAPATVTAGSATYNPPVLAHGEVRPVGANTQNL